MSATNNFDDSISEPCGPVPVVSGRELCSCISFKLGEFHAGLAKKKMLLILRYRCVMLCVHGSSSFVTSVLAEGDLRAGGQ
jgi:hypothetical protein